MQIMWNYIRAGTVGGVWGLGLGFMIGASVSALVNILVGVLVHNHPIAAIPDPAPLQFQFAFSWSMIALSSLFWGGLLGGVSICSGIIVGCVRFHRSQKSRVADKFNVL